MESSSPTLRLPRVVRAAALNAIGGRSAPGQLGAASGELAWMSWAGTVWRLAGPQGAVFVKRAAELSAERDRLAWLAGRWPVPEMVDFFHVADDDWLLTREVAGVPFHRLAVGAEPSLIATEFGAILRVLHSVDATDCPFGKSGRGHVLVHGDYCLPNVLVQAGALSGIVDVGRAGLGDPQVDLAAGVWTLDYNFGKGFARDFLNAYGWPPITDAAIEQLRRRYARRSN